jgi:hypothetical protein
LESLIVLSLRRNAAIPGTGPCLGSRSRPASHQPERSWRSNERQRWGEQRQGQLCKSSEATSVKIDPVRGQEIRINGRNTVQNMNGGRLYGSELRNLSAAPPGNLFSWANRYQLEILYRNQAQNVQGLSNAARTWAQMWRVNLGWAGRVAGTAGTASTVCTVSWYAGRGISYYTALDHVLESGWSPIFAQRYTRRPQRYSGRRWPRGWECRRKTRPARCRSRHLIPTRSSARLGLARRISSSPTFSLAIPSTLRTTPGKPRRRPRWWSSPITGPRPGLQHL